MMIRTRRPIWRTVTDSSSEADRTLRNGEKLLVDTSGGTVTVILPFSPAEGWRCKVRDKKQSFATNNLTISRNGLNIDGAAADMVVARNAAEIDLTYSDSTEGWVSFGLYAAIGTSFSRVVLTNARLNAGAVEVKSVTLSWDGENLTESAESAWTATPL